MIEPCDLKIGDILLTKDETYHFYRHVYVVTEIDKDNSIYKVIHWLGMREPFSIIESTLPSKEVLNEKNCNLECFRLHDAQQAEKAANILKLWLTWGVPYSQKRFKTLELTMNSFFSVKSDIMNYQPPKGCKEKFPEKLEPNRKQLEELFRDNYKDIIKYAARRDLSPVKPKQDCISQNGFHCVQGILLAFQVSYITEFVNSITDKWLSNKHISFDNSSIIFESAERALNSNFELEKFLSKIPKAFMLYAKLCWVDTFRHAMLEDTSTIQFLGTISPLEKAAIKPDPETMQLRVQALKLESFFKRKQLLEEIVIPSANKIT